MKPVEIAKKTIQLFVKEGKIFIPPAKVEDLEVNKAGVFVSIKTLDANLRGCIGTILPQKETVAQEIVYNAISAATEDPRFLPIQENELDNLVISVDILCPPEDISSTDELDVKKYGVIAASKSGRRGLLLPDLEGVDTVERQIQICKMKAGISENEPISLQRFKVERYYE
ncbi:MAG: AmmeMemoRadiSam system protein A [Candidatus Gastranaerophilaceae bacterium]